MAMNNKQKKKSYFDVRNKYITRSIKGNLEDVNYKLIAMLAIYLIFEMAFQC